MGAILATPSKNARNEGLVEQNNNFQNEKSKPAPFKFHIVQECFPALAGKENKFFNEKVPSYWSKTKSDAKKRSKQKAEIYTQVSNHTKNKDIHQPITLIPPYDEKNKQTFPKCPPNPDRHFYGTLNLSETLKYIGCYVYLRCRNLEGLKPSIVVGWIRGIDRSLVLSGWQEMGFISQPNMVVVYMLLREVIPAKVRSISQLKAIMMSTLYMCYAYNGHEISYPLKPFLFDGDRTGFWSRCMEIINDHSDKLLRVNKEPKYYNDIQIELKTFGRSLERKDK